MGKCLDLTGQKFGKLTVIKQAEHYISPKGKYKARWFCLCECGNEVIVHADSLKSGRTTSCGCVRKEKTSNINKKHGLRNSRLYIVWNNMKERCYNPNHNHYKHYGARGITICDEWKNDFQSFYDWAMSNDYKEDLTIDRIDVNGNYEPSNCRWITNKEQQRNRTNNKLITINGETKCLPEWCELLNLNYNTVRTRINNYHWSPERALEII